MGCKFIYQSYNFQENIMQRTFLIHKFNKRLTCSIDNDFSYSNLTFKF